MIYGTHFGNGCHEVPVAHLSEPIRKWVKGCDNYLQVKASSQVTVGLLSLLEIPATRGERINIDFTAKLPITKNGNDTIVTITDGLRKRVRRFAEKEAELTMENIATLFQEHYIRSSYVG
jgi:hypothetical protein